MLTTNKMRRLAKHAKYQNDAFVSLWLEAEGVRVQTRIPGQIQELNRIISWYDMEYLGETELCQIINECVERVHTNDKKSREFQNQTQANYNQRLDDAIKKYY